MLNFLSCNACGKNSTEVAKIVTLHNIAVCDQCVVEAAREVGILPAKPRVPAVPLREPRSAKPASFTFIGELDGHMNHSYDNFLCQSAVITLRACFPDVAIDVIRVERLDDCSPDLVAAGRARYRVVLLIRSRRPISQFAYRNTMTEKWSDIADTNAKLLKDKGTRDLVEPKLMGLVGYIMQRATWFRLRKNGGQD